MSTVLNPSSQGVTFLAFGNGAPDLFSAIAAFLAMKAGDAGLAIGGLFGEFSSALIEIVVYFIID